MCGIFGSTFNLDRPLLDKKLSFLSKRGPDFQDIKTYGKVTLGHTRLSIIDLEERSNQPFDYEHLSITFNGEIYNYKELKEDLINEGYKFNTTSDTEVVCALFLSKGKEFLAYLNGMFSFVIYDKKANILLGARDRLGKKPLYYLYNEKNIEFSSSLYSIAAGNTTTLNREAIKAYLEWGYVPEPLSILNDVYKLEQGFAFEYDLDKKELKKWKYWDIPLVSSAKLSFNEAVDHLDYLLNESTKKRMMSDVPLGVFLSGGVDSSLVAAIAQKNNSTPLKTFCVGFEESEFDESEYAKNIANYLGTDHTHISMSCALGKELIVNMQEYFDEPHDDSSAIGQLLLSKATKAHVTVAVSGDGGDELFLGYNQYTTAKKKELLYTLPLLVRKTLALPFAYLKSQRSYLINQGLKLNGIEDFHKSFYSQLDRRWLNFERKEQTNEKYLYSNKPLLERLSDFDIKTYLCGDILTKVDRATMAFSLEARSPILDYQILEFAKSLPVNFKYNQRQKKIILRKLLGRYLPKNLFERPKRGFAIPVGDWFRQDLKSYLEDTLTPEALLEIPEINYDQFKKILDDHFENRWNNTSKIYRVLMLVQWLKKYNGI